MRSLAKWLLVGGFVAWSGSALAITQDGTLSGIASTGSADVTLTTGTAYMVSNFNTFALGNFTGASLTGADGICVYSNDTVSYTLTIDSANNLASGTYRLTDGTNFLNYRVGWQPSTGAGSYATSTNACAGATGAAGPVVLPNTPCAAPSSFVLLPATANAVSTSCSGLTNATLSVFVDAADLAAAGSAAWSDTVTVTISP